MSVEISGSDKSLRVAGLMAVLIAALFGCAFLLYLAPNEAYRFGLADEGAAPFRAALRLPTIAALSTAQFVWSFRAFVAVAWGAWAALVIGEFRRPTLAIRPVLSIVALCAGTMAIIAPPVLSNDVYAYVAYGRLAFRHGLNPYLFDRPALEAASDPAAAFLIWGTPLAYGPLWTLIATAVAAVSAPFGLIGELLAHKMLAALSLVAAAWAGGRLANASEPGRGVLTTIAIGLNPLLLIEGPGSGHNDLAMMALVLAGAAVGSSRRWVGALGIGLAAAIKATAITLVPLVALDRILASKVTGYRDAFATILLGLLPVLALSMLYGGPRVLWDSLSIQVTAGHQASRLTAARIAMVPAFLWGIHILRAARQSTPSQAWLVAWLPVALVLALLFSPVPFPWYVTWPLVATLTAWDERHRLWLTVVATLAFMLMWLYVVAP